VRRLRFQPQRLARALVLYRLGSDGSRRDRSQLEQGLASLVLVVLVAILAGQLLDWFAACRVPGWSADCAICQRREIVGEKSPCVKQTERDGIGAHRYPWHRKLIFRMNG
jgi:hypothetical protein